MKRYLVTLMTEILHSEGRNIKHLLQEVLSGRFRGDKDSKIVMETEEKDKNQTFWNIITSFKHGPEFL